MTLYEALYLFGGLTGGTTLGFVVSALFSGSKRAVAEDVLASLIELRKFFGPAGDFLHSRRFSDWKKSIARADLAILRATEQAAPIAAPQSYFE